VWSRALTRYALLAAALMLACRRPDPPQKKPLVPMQTPTFEGSKARSYSQPYASSLRNSQVFVARKHFAEISRHAIERCRGASRLELRPPYFLIASPDGRHGVFGSELVSEVFETGGCAEGWTAGDYVAFDDLFLAKGEARTWGLGDLDQRNLHGDALARRVEPERYAGAAFDPGGNFEKSNTPPVLRVEGGRRFPKYLGDGIDFTLTLKEKRGVAAIGGDFAFVLALDDGQLQVYSPSVDEQGHARLAAECKVPEGARWVSLIGSRIALVVPDGTSSRLLVFSADAKPLFSTTVPFEVLQPPIAGAGQRIYLAGTGLAALDDDKVAWLHGSLESTYATSFEDGSLAVASGVALELVRPDGSIDQRFNTQEPIVAPPVITGDGSVWVASKEAVYIAR